MDKEERMAYLQARRKDVDRLLMAFQLREGGPEDLQEEDRALAEVMAQQGMIHLHQRYTVDNGYLALHPQQAADLLPEPCRVCEDVPDKRTEKYLERLDKSVKNATTYQLLFSLAFLIGVILGFFVK